MKKILAVVLCIFSTCAYAQTGQNYTQYPLQNYPTGFRLIDGSQLNQMVGEVNSLTGNSSIVKPLVGSKLTINGSTGSATPPTPATGTLGQFVGANATNARIEVDAFGGVSVISLRRADGTIAAPTALVSGDELGSLNYWGAKSASAYYGGAARVSAFATENWSGTAGGTKILFSTTPNTTQILTDAVIIDQDGGIKGISAAQGTALALTGGASSTSANNGGLVSLTGGLAGATGNGGAVALTGGVGGATSGSGGALTLTSGAAGATTGVAGAINIAVGATTVGNGPSVTITAGAGASATNAGGNVNLVPGAAVSTGIPGTVQFNGNAGLTCPTYYYTGTPAATNQVFFVATRPSRLVSISEVHSTAAGGASTLDITKDTGITTPAGGSTIMNGGTFNLNATANTVQVGTPSATIATVNMAAGDRLAVKFNNTIQSTVGVVVTACLAPV